MFSKPGRAKIRTNLSDIQNRAKIQHKAVMLSALQLIAFNVARNALLNTAETGVKIIRFNQRMNGSWDMYLASPADFAEVDDIIINLAKVREPGIKIIESTP